jgi:hypothetical protein
METFFDRVFLAGIVLLGMFVILTVEQDTESRFHRARWMVVFTCMLALGTVIGFTLGFVLASDHQPSTTDLPAMILDLLLALALFAGGIGVWLKKRGWLVAWLLGITWQVSSYAINHIYDMSAPQILQSPLVTIIGLRQPIPSAGSCRGSIPSH